MTRNVFVLGCDRFNLDQIKSARAAEGCRFHALTTYDEAKAGDEIPAEKLLDKARARLDAFDGSIDAILGWWDFPVSTLLPILRREYGTPGPTLESTLRCEHKYWSRLEQSRSVPDHIPAFRLFDPDAPTRIRVWTCSTRSGSSRSSRSDRTWASGSRTATTSTPRSR